MAVRRFDRRKTTTCSPPMSISPWVGSSWPAIMRRIVVLPQPDGPRKAAICGIRNLQVDAVDNRGDAVIALDDPCQFDAFHSRSAYRFSFPSGPLGPLARRFWIRAMVPRQTPMMTNEIRVVTVPRA